MSKSELKKIEKNLKLSAEFQEYVLRHPKILDDLPPNSKIILDDEITKADKNNIYRAVNNRSGWQLVSASG